MSILEKLSRIGLVPVIRVTDPADAVPLCRTLTEGGLPVAEITFRLDTAEEAIRRVHAELPEVLLGAGTVLTVDQVDRALAAGASYLVSPGLNPEVVRHAQDRGAVVVPGVATATEIEAALSLGLTTVKFFPAEAAGGLPAIKALSAPYRMMRFLPTGGISPANLQAYLAHPSVIACGGSWMVPSEAVDAQDWPRIRALAEEAARLVRAVRTFD